MCQKKIVLKCPVPTVRIVFAVSLIDFLHPSVQKRGFFMGKKKWSDARQKRSDIGIVYNVGTAIKYYNKIVIFCI